MISLCIISRKEDSVSLSNALRSVQGFVDEIIVIDTGKEPIGILESGRNAPKTDKVFSDFGEIRLIPFEWTNDFAAARNFSFEQAKGDIIFTIDSDDIVLHPENLPKLAKRIENGEADWIYCEYIYSRNETGDIQAKHWKPRLFRKDTGHWVGNVHEDFTPDEVVIQRKDIDLGKDRLIIEHKATGEELEGHSQRNLDIQLAEIERDGEKVDPRTLQYTGMSYQGLGQYELAVYWFLRHVKVTGSKEDKFWSLYRVAMCLYFLGRNEEALNFALDSLKLFPEWKSSYLLIASIYTVQEDWKNVIEWTLTGLEKSDPDTMQMVNELDYTILPLGRLAMAYLQTGNYDLANTTAIEVYQMNPEYPGSRDLVKMCVEAISLEGFVKSFLEVVQNVKKYDRVKATQLFDLIPKELDEDYRIQSARSVIVKPMIWPKKSVAIYCGRSLEEWSYPSIFTGIGGSEEAVINMSKELVAQGYSVTVYNRCGDMKGMYEGVEYLPYYYFNKRDHFDTLIIWRNPLAFADTFNAKRKYLWMHDIAHPEHFNQKIYDNIDKIFFLSKWHRSNLPDCPEEKVFITNNGIDPEDFRTLPAKRPNSLIWASSYDRGLLPFIKNIFPLIKKAIPDVTLDVAYGWNNIEKEMDLIPALKELYTELSHILGEPGEPLLVRTHGKWDNGIIHHGRISHRKLAELMGSSIVYPYASEFGETCNITSQKMQAAGVYVVTTSQAGGTPERVITGKVIDGEGIYSDKKLQADFAKVVIQELQKSQRMSLQTVIQKKTVMDKFAWSTTAKQWIKELSL